MARASASTVPCDHAVALEAIDLAPQLGGQQRVERGGHVEPLGNGAHARIGRRFGQRAHLEQSADDRACGCPGSRCASGPGCCRGRRRQSASSRRRPRGPRATQVGRQAFRSGASDSWSCRASSARSHVARTRSCRASLCSVVRVSVARGAVSVVSGVTVDVPRSRAPKSSGTNARAGFAAKARVRVAAWRRTSGSTSSAAQARNRHADCSSAACTNWPLPT